jgi:hypothetical protein
MTNSVTNPTCNLPFGTRRGNDSQNAYLDLPLVLDHYTSDSMGCRILFHAVSLPEYYSPANLWLTDAQPAFDGCKSRWITLG